MERTRENPNDSDKPGVKIGEQVSDLKDGQKPVRGNEIFEDQGDGSTDPDANIDESDDVP